MWRRDTRAHDFDRFVRALQSEVGAAQEAMARRHEGVVRRMVEYDNEGNEWAITWNLCLPSPTAGKDGSAETRLPLLSLRKLALPQVAGVSMELLAAVEEAQEPGPTGIKRLVLVIRRRRGILRRALHRITIRLMGRQPGRGDVCVDDVPFKRIGDGRG